MVMGTVHYAVDYGVYCREHNMEIGGIYSVLYRDGSDGFDPRYVICILRPDLRTGRKLIVREGIESERLRIVYGGKEYAGIGSLERLRAVLEREKIEKMLEKL